VTASSLSTPTAIVLIAACLFVVLALLAFGRTMFRRHPPAARRFRVGVFVERDHEQTEDDTDPK
jgi:hypothetical protein